MKTKTAVVYDKWLDSLGGGEMVACHIARALLDNNYDVTFVSGKKVPHEDIVNRLGIDISKCKFVEIWNDEYELQELTDHKDIFINTTFMDYSCGRAKANYYYCHFPTPEFTGPKSYINNKILLPLFYKLLKPKELTQSAGPTTFVNGKISYSINKTNELCFYNLEKGKIYLFSTFIYLESFSKIALEQLTQHIQNGTALETKKIIYHHNNEIEFRQKIKATKNNIALSFCLPENISPAFVINSEIRNPLLPYKLNLLKSRLEIRLRAGYFKNISTRMNTYNKVFSNSEFTKKWVKKYWSTESTVLYPPVNPINPAKKKNIISSVGRFFTRGHDKKQEIMIKTFIQMCDSGLKNWELHLAGGISTTEESTMYFIYLKQLIQGYPIHIHTNRPRKFIENLLGESAIYWHAAGFGENENTNPIKFEHFGISTVEAISADCIPVVYNGGGLTEIIEKSGFDPNTHTFNSMTDLATKTNYIIKNIDNIQKASYTNKFNIFSKTSFYTNLLREITS